LPNIFTAITAHLPAADDNSLIGRTSHDSTDDWSQPVPISLTAYAHFGARLGAFFYQTRFIWSTMYRSTIPLQFI